MKSLLILRHAKSSWKEPGTRDHDRPLNKRGKRDAPRIGELIKTEGVVPDLIVSSTALRAKTTACTVAEHARYDGELVFEPDLYLAAPEVYIEQLSLLPDDVTRVMMVGHNPGLAQLLYLTTNRDEPFPTAALADVEWDIEAWDEIARSFREGTLRHYWIPRELD